MGASTKDELKNKPEQILKNLNEASINLNKDKCELNYDKVLYLGYQIWKDGILPNEKLTQKIAEMSAQRSKKELESFWRLTYFYSVFIQIQWSDSTVCWVTQKKRWL